MCGFASGEERLFEGVPHGAVTESEEAASPESHSVDHFPLRHRRAAERFKMEDSPRWEAAPCPQAALGVCPARSSKLLMLAHPAEARIG